MGRAAVERRWLEFTRSGQATVKTGVLRGVLWSAVLVSVSLLTAGMSLSAFQEDGTGSPKAWVCAFVAVLLLVGVGVTMAPVVRRRELVLNHDGFVVSSRRHGRRTCDLQLRWVDIEDVAIHSRSSGEGTSYDVRLSLSPGVRADAVATGPQAFVDLPDGLAMSKKDLAALLERAHLSRR